MNTQPADLAKPYLLVVDDEESVRTPLNYAFKGQFNMVLCRNSAEALEAVAKHPIDVAILDIKMTNESGLDLLRKIKAAEPLIEVIILTGYSTQEHMKTAWESDAFGFHSKPFDIQQLSQLLEKGLKLRAASTSAKAAVERIKLVDAGLIELQSGLIHDLNNLLTAAFGFTGLLSSKMSDKTHIPAEEMDSLRVDIENISKPIDLCGALCARNLRILRFATGAGGAGSAEPTEPADQIINDVAGALRGHTGIRNAQFRIVSSVKPLPALHINPVALFQILLNLGINAAQSTDRVHEVLIECRTLSNNINTSILVNSATSRVVGLGTFPNKPPFLVITITDTGSGIPPQVIRKLFDSHYTTKPKGTGVGLPLVCTLVTRNQCLLHLETQPGKGTSVSVYFPCRGPESFALPSG
jgi:signal transduction histidine kinase